MYGGPKNKKSALMALAAAGGMWAWQNRDKIRGWISSQSGQMSGQMSHRKETGGYVGETRRIGSHYAVDSADTAAEAPRTYDANI